MDQCCQYSVTQGETRHKDIDKLKTASAGSTETDDISSGFDCNICLDSVQDPVVTFCGHLYCWPCIYMWLHSQKASEDPDRTPQCPVCKARISQNTLIPLYGRDKCGKPSATHFGVAIPQRPNGKPELNCRGGRLNHREVDPYYSLGDYAPSTGSGFAGTTTFYPVIGMFGEMICARFFRNSETNLYTYPNTYSVATTSSARSRRHVIQAERSLSRVSFFLFCCIIMCLLLF
ncbi:hypothetical protein RND81_14G025700 [Saponaria officinalis]|uniref:E3 ubiquitin-protein ligase RMA n=1 Tax=Saponaria officinalis TaxID=3572 RepID=A0AAW1GGR9_SAPOF